VAAHYVVSEALTNAAKYAQASGVRVSVDAEYAHLRLSISDDGVGGADAHKGSGLTGLVDRVEALGGTAADLQRRWERNVTTGDDPIRRVLTFVAAADSG
jgi:glucose-6-phosphate-specific signal transduction histidine kinase